MEYIMPIMNFDCIDNKDAVIQLDMNNRTLSLVENGSIYAEATPERVQNWHKLAKRMGKLLSYYNYDGKLLSID